MKLKPRAPDKKALRRSFWSALGRLIGVSLSAGGGSLLYHSLGSSTSIAVSVAIGMLVGGFLASWFAEYEREIDP
jgi:hypothetical protein